MPDLIAGGELPYDLMSYSSVYFGDFVATGQIEPLDRYLEQYRASTSISRASCQPIGVLHEVRR